MISYQVHGCVANFSDLTVLFLRVPGGIFSAQDIQQHPLQEVVVSVLSEGQLKWGGASFRENHAVLLFQTI